MKYDLPNTYMSEYVEYQRLFILGNSRTSTGNPSFTSTSSGVTYTVSANTGENGMLALLKAALSDYLVSASDWNGLDEIISTGLRKLRLGGIPR